MAGEKTNRTPPDNQPFKIVADPDIDYSKTMVKLPELTPMMELSPPTSQASSDLLLIAQLQTDMENRYRRIQYLENKRTEYEADLTEIGGLSPSERRDIEGKIAKLTKDIRHLEEENEKLREIIRIRSKSIAQTTHYDRALIFRNLRWLIKEKGIKLGQIEREASGCQPGYLARLERSSNTEPSLEFIVTASQRLGISIDLLLEADLAELTPTERYLIDFLAQLQKDTVMDKLNWKTETPSQLSDVGIDEEYNPSHPLFTLDTEDYVDFNGVTETRPITVFDSRSFGKDTVIDDDCYNLRMPDKTTLYVMKVKSRKAEKKDEPDLTSAIEVWMTQRRTTASFICSTKDNAAIKDSITGLYSTIKAMSTHPKINNYFKRIIDSYMQGNIPEDPN